MSRSWAISALWQGGDRTLFSGEDEEEEEEEVGLLLLLLTLASSANLSFCKRRPRKNREKSPDLLSAYVFEALFGLVYVQYIDVCNRFDFHRLFSTSPDCHREFLMAAKKEGGGEIYYVLCSSNRTQGHKHGWSGPTMFSPLDRICSW